MPDIRDYPNLPILKDWIEANFARGIRTYAEIEELEEDFVNKLELQEVVVVGEYGRGDTKGKDPDEPLRLMFVLDVDGFVTSDTEVYEVVGGASSYIFNKENREEIEETSDIEIDFIEKTSVMEEWFDEIQAAPVPSDQFAGAFNRFVQIRQSSRNRGYSLTLDQNIIATEDGITREPANVVIDDHKVEDHEMVGDILQYPDLPSLRESLADTFIAALEQVEDSVTGDLQELLRLELVDVVAVGEWGEGKAEPGIDPLNLFFFVDDELVEARAISPVNRTLRRIEDSMEEIFNPTSAFQNWFNGFNFRVTEEENMDSVLESQIQDPDEGRAVGLITETLYTVDVSPPAYRPKLQRSNLEIEGEPDLPEAEEPEEEEPEEPEEEEERKTREEILEERFPETPAELRPFAEEDGELEIPINKSTQTVKARPLYEFEQELLSPEDGGTSIPEMFEEGIGFAKATGAFGTGIPPASFPRVGTYIKYHLLYQGPSYLLEMYRDLVVYSGYMSSIHGIEAKVMTYDSFREYVYRLKEISEAEEHPELIDPLTQQAAAARGLSTVPELPNGQDAPWLERRQYYTVVEDNIDHEAWNNPGDYLYERVRS